MTHQLPALPYEFSDLEPHIDARTMEIHHGKHHNAYVTNLNAALILPDGKVDTPTFLVFDNYEKILKWNRSLRFGISVCTLAGMIKA